MKNLIVALCCLFTLALSAQTLTQEQLQGSWKLIYFEGDGISLDFKAKTFTISEELREMYSPEDIAGMEEDLQGMLDEGIEMIMVFNKNIMAYEAVGTDEEKTEGVFEIKAGNPDKLLFASATEKGKVNTYDAFIKEGNLYMKEGKAGQTLIYSKIK